MVKIPKSNSFEAGLEEFGSGWISNKPAKPQAPKKAKTPGAIGGNLTGGAFGSQDWDGWSTNGTAPTGMWSVTPDWMTPLPTTGKKKSTTPANTVGATGGGNTGGGNTGGGNTGGGNATGGTNTGGGTDTGGSTDAGGSTDTGGDVGGATSSGGFAFAGQEPLSATGRTALIGDPYAFASAWLQSLGGSFATPTMMAALGQFPAIADSLDMILYGGSPEVVGQSLDDNYTLEQRQKLLEGQLQRGGGIDSWSAIQNMLNLGSEWASTPITEVDNPLAATLLGLGVGGAEFGAQADQVNNLIQIAMVNSNPIYANTIRNLLNYYKTQYIAEQGQRIDTETSAQPYVEWLRNKGVLLG